jgi:hypothetical protein
MSGGTARSCMNSRPQTKGRSKVSAYARISQPLRCVAFTPARVRSLIRISAWVNSGPSGHGSGQGRLAAFGSGGLPHRNTPHRSRLPHVWIALDHGFYFCTRHLQHAKPFIYRASGNAAKLTLYETTVALVSLIVRNGARGLFRDSVPVQITHRRCQRVNLVLIGPELDLKLTWAAGDHDLTIGRIVAGSGDLE